jgi:ABC-type antimicrobial peptide transport system permease subunit
MEKILQIILVLILSSTKFLTAPITALNIGFGYLQTLGLTMVGGIFGVLFFYFLSSGIMFLMAKVSSRFSVNRTPSKKRAFTWKNRMIVKVKRDYGLIGLAAITPTMLSIPVGTFLAARFFPNTPKVLTYLIASVMVWSVLISSVVIMF